MARSIPLSIRLDRRLLERLDRRSRDTGESRAELVRRYADEALRMEEHPLIVFRTGISGRYAAAIGGPKVWTVVGVMKGLGVSGETGAKKVARYLEIEEGLVRAALDYYAEYPDEIDATIRRNEEESARLYEAWRRQQAAAA